MIFSGIRFKLTVDRKIKHLLPSHHCGLPPDNARIELNDSHWFKKKKSKYNSLNRAGCKYHYSIHDAKMHVPKHYYSQPAQCSCLQCSHTLQGNVTQLINVDRGSLKVCWDKKNKHFVRTLYCYETNVQQLGLVQTI